MLPKLDKLSKKEAKKKNKLKGILQNCCENLTPEKLPSFDDLKNLLSDPFDNFLPGYIDKLAKGIAKNIGIDIDENTQPPVNAIYLLAVLHAFSTPNKPSEEEINKALSKFDKQYNKDALTDDQKETLDEGRMHYAEVAKTGYLSKRVFNHFVATAMHAHNLEVFYAEGIVNKTWDEALALSEKYTLEDLYTLGTHKKTTTRWESFLACISCDPKQVSEGASITRNQGSTTADFSSSISTPQQSGSGSTVSLTPTPSP